ncbi:MAG: adenylate/guanylate cyclase domain-containing protein, partial [Anaerolineaceae bacterium]
GDLALRLELVDEAARWYQTGLAWAERERCPVELGRNLQGLAAVAEHRGDAPTALAFLDRAAAQYQPHGIKLYLEQVIRKKVELQGIGSQDMGSSIVAVTNAVQAERPNLTLNAAPDGSITLMFTDIENSTALTEQLGDAKWLEILREHNAVVQREVKRHGGKVVKNRGDGYMLTFASPAHGLDCALAIQQALAEHEVIRVRIGLHTGNPTREGEDFFGTDVNLAARVADKALGGQVLVSERVHALLARAHPERFGEAVEVGLKGLAGSHRLYPVQWAN